MYDVVYTRKTGALAGGSAAHTAINESQATRCGAGGWGWGWGWGFGDWGEGECGFQVEGRPGGAHGQVEAGGGGNLVRGCSVVKSGRVVGSSVRMEGEGKEWKGEEWKGVEREQAPSHHRHHRHCRQCREICTKPSREPSTETTTPGRDVGLCVCAYVCVDICVYLE